jgi:predicted nucleic acid-binding protein
MLVAIDTKHLAYAEGAGDESRRAQAVALLTRLPEASVLLPVQVLGELFRVLVGKLRQTPAAARDAVLHWSDAYAVRDSTWSALQSAFDLSAAHGLSIWDSLILSVAAEQRCRVLLSEDMQHGFTWRGTTVVNPFTKPVHTLLGELLESSLPAPPRKR